jgi:predicted HAD superfamily phosphohydrolase YqeG
MPTVPLIIYVDVDDTLVRSAGSKRIPMPSMISHVRELAKEGAILYCWSSGGGDYAKQTAEELGIVDCFAAFLPKPNVVIDDQSVIDWAQTMEIHPQSIGGKVVTDYWQSIQSKRRI